MGFSTEWKLCDFVQGDQKGPLYIMGHAAWIDHSYLCHWSGFCITCISNCDRRQHPAIHANRNEHEKYTGKTCWEKFLRHRYQATPLIGTLQKLSSLLCIQTVASVLQTVCCKILLLPTYFHL